MTVSRAAASMSSYDIVVKSTTVTPSLGGGSAAASAGAVASEGSSPMYLARWAARKSESG